jgi:hypothetical protein
LFTGLWNSGYFLRALLKLRTPPHNIAGPDKQKNEPNKRIQSVTNIQELCHVDVAECY